MRLHSSLQHVLLYEDKDLQRRAREMIPLAELEKRAKEASERTKQGGDGGVDERDCLVLELLNWFKGKCTEITNCQRSSVVCTLIDSYIRDHSGQNDLELQGTITILTSNETILSVRDHCVTR